MAITQTDIWNVFGSSFGRFELGRFGRQFQIYNYRI